MGNKELIAAGILLGAMPAMAAKVDKKASGKGARPNIIFILADDLGYGDLSCYGQQRYTTPNLDRLASNGVRFTNHYTGSSVSAPSRCALLTGMHTGHAAVRGNEEVDPEGQQPMPATTVTIAKLLQQAGYKTGITGKWGLGYPGSVSTPNKMGFDYFFGYNCQREAHFAFPEHLWENDRRVEYPENQNAAHKTWSQEEIMSHAKTFIRSNSRNPFFLYLSVTVPHAEMVLPERHIKDFVGKYPEKPFPGNHYGRQDYPHAAYAAMVTWLDGQVGELQSLLKSLNIDSNTVIMFASDNGPHAEGGNDPYFFNSNGGYRGIKRDLYEGGIRTPLIVSWPKTVKPGQVSHHVGAFWDIMPTICDIASVKAPQNIDGVSFYPTLMGKKVQEHEYLYWEFHEMGKRQAIRMGKWKAVRLNVANPEKTKTELYDLSVDPYEKSDVSATNPEIMKKMELLFTTARTGKALK